MDEREMKEVDAFNWIQKSAMRERVTMREIARRIINDGLRPEGS
jgi:AmiR/NasT family two-component response regulator